MNPEIVARRAAQKQAVMDRLKLLEAHLTAAKITVYSVCRDAKVPTNYWYRWRAGKATPRPKQWRAIVKALPPKLRKYAA